MAEEGDNLFPTAVNDTIIGKVNDVVNGDHKEQEPIMPEGEEIPIIEADETPKSPPKSKPTSGKNSRQSSQKQTPQNTPHHSQNTSPRTGNIILETLTANNGLNQEAEQREASEEHQQNVDEQENKGSKENSAHESKENSSKNSSRSNSSKSSKSSKSGENSARSDKSKHSDNEENKEEKGEHETSELGSESFDDNKETSKEFEDDEEEQRRRRKEEEEEEQQQRMQTAPTHRRKKAPTRYLTYWQEQKKIPADIRNNPYVAIRTNTYPVKKTKPPRAAQSATEYRPRRTVNIDEYTQALLDGKEPEEEPTIEQLRASAFQLRHLERDLVDKSDYRAAKNANKCFNYVTERLKKDSYMKNSKNSIQELISKRNELTALIQHIEADYDNKIEEHNEIMAEKARDMRRQHEEELEQFDENKPTELEPLFKRNSVTYFKMRSEERHLALNKKFDEALKKKKQADNLQILEEQQAYEKQDDHYREKKMRLIEHQNRVVTHFSQYANGRLLEIKAAKAKALAPMIHRVNNLDRLIETMCERRGIKPQQLDFESVDNERVEMLKTKETGGQIPTRSRSSASNRPATIRKPKVSPKN